VTKPGTHGIGPGVPGIFKRVLQSFFVEFCERTGETAGVPVPFEREIGVSPAVGSPSTTFVLRRTEQNFGISRITTTTRVTSVTDGGVTTAVGLLAPSAGEQTVPGQSRGGREQQKRHSKQDRQRLPTEIHE
jgi:hypothetical protein